MTDGTFSAATAGPAGLRGADLDIRAEEVEVWTYPVALASLKSLAGDILAALSCLHRPKRRPNRSHKNRTSDCQKTRSRAIAKDSSRHSRNSHQAV